MGRKTIAIQEFYCAIEKIQSSKVIYFEDQYQMNKKNLLRFISTYVTAPSPRTKKSTILLKLNKSTDSYEFTLRT